MCIVGAYLAELLEYLWLISGAIPMPVSLTEISTEPSACLALIPIRPPSGVNFTALDSKLSSICLIFLSSPTKSPRRSSTVTSRLMPCFVARSRTKVRALSIARGRSNVANLQLHPTSLHLG